MGGRGGEMFMKMMRLASTVSDYTIGTAIVLVHLALVGPRDTLSQRLLPHKTPQHAN